MRDRALLGCKDTERLDDSHRITELAGTIGLAQRGARPRFARLQTVPSHLFSCRGHAAELGPRFARPQAIHRAPRQHDTGHETSHGCRTRRRGQGGVLPRSPFGPFEGPRPLHQNPKAPAEGGMGKWFRGPLLDHLRAPAPTPEPQRTTHSSPGSNFVPGSVRRACLGTASGTLSAPPRPPSVTFRVKMCLIKRAVRSFCSGSPCLGPWPLLLEPIRSVNTISERMCAGLQNNTYLARFWYLFCPQMGPSGTQTQPTGTPWRPPRSQRTEGSSVPGRPGGPGSPGSPETPHGDPCLALAPPGQVFGYI